ncbi:alpha/beta fold hydrolase [Paenibacillus senegalensis]|uniref:alpha/beta fold hydrolase n=1 Tax=Paenibacillus senegalensis TaxID=1465766 RepID=UPI000288B544|nr:alpha/beta hydrolase [Paenibacillus senegalensis]
MENQKLSNQVKLSYEDRGSGNAVVLLHGFCGSSQYWKEIIPLLETAYRVIVPDLRGHGASSVPDEPYLMETIATDIALLLDKLGIDKAVLCGHSMGGYAASAFAGAYPNKLAGLSLIHSTTLPDDEGGKQKRTEAMELIRKEGVAPFVEGLIPKLFADQTLQINKAIVQQAVDIGNNTPPLGAIRSAEGMRERIDRTLIVEKLQVPVLLVAGSKDKVISPDKTFTPQGAHIHKHKIEKAGHMSMMECPDELIEPLKTFLAQCY